MVCANVLRCGHALQRPQLHASSFAFDIEVRVTITGNMRHRHTILEHYLFRARNGSMLMCLGLGTHDMSCPTLLCWSSRENSSINGSRRKAHLSKRLYRRAGSMFNHSSRPNIDYRVNVAQLLITFSASRDIEQGAPGVRRKAEPAGLIVALS